MKKNSVYSKYILCVKIYTTIQKFGVIKCFISYLKKILILLFSNYVLN